MVDDLHSSANTKYLHCALQIVCLQDRRTRDRRIRLPFQFFFKNSKILDDPFARKNTIGDQRIPNSPMHDRNLLRRRQL